MPRLLRPLAAVLLVTLVPFALADAPSARPDFVYPLADVSGVAFHGFLGMCYLDEATCPFPWDVPGNYVGPACLKNSDASHVYVACNGAWKDLWFNFILPGGASMRGPVLSGAAGQDDLIHIVGMHGTVAMSCDFSAPPGAPACTTNFAGSSAYVERWDCYIHERGADGYDCPNDGP